MSMMKIKKLGIFCGAKIGNNSFYAKAAKELASLMVQAGITLVYGGAKVGLMGVLADQVLKENGEAIGVLPRSLSEVEIAHPHLSELYIVNTMHERKAKIAELADGFILLPGGAGSLDEFFEILTWAQLGFHRKPCGILNVENYYDYLLRFLDHVVEQAFLKPVYRNMIIVEESSHALLSKLNHYQAPLENKLINYSNLNCPI